MTDAKGAALIAQMYCDAARFYRGLAHDLGELAAKHEADRSVWSMRAIAWGNRDTAATLPSLTPGGSLVPWFTEKR